MNPKTLGQPKIEFEKLPETLISESKIICWHFRNYPHDGKRNAIPSQIKHWETLRGLCYYLHFTREETENQKVKISCPRPVRMDNSVKPHVAWPRVHGRSPIRVTASFSEQKKEPFHSLTWHHFPSSRTMVNWFFNASVGLVYCTQEDLWKVWVWNVSILNKRGKNLGLFQIGLHIRWPKYWRFSFSISPSMTL